MNMRLSVLSFGLVAFVAGAAELAKAPPMADDKLLEELIRIPSVSSDVPKVNEAVRCLRRRLESDGLSCRTETMPGGRQVLFAANVGTKTPDVLFSAHLDVVPAQTPDLFQPRRENGVIYGRGSSDCKEHCVLAARLLRELKGKVSVGCLFGSDEEIGGYSTEFMLNLGYGASKLVIVLDAEQYALTTRSKGIANFIVTETAEAAHTGSSKALKNSALELVAGYHALTNALPKVSPGEYGDTVLLDRISGGREKAEMVIRVRYVTDASLAHIDGLVRKIFRGPVAFRSEGGPVCMDEKEPVLCAFRDRMQAKWPNRKIGFYHAGGATDARYLQRLGLPMLITGVDARGAHTPEERLIWSSMDEHADLIGEFLLQFLGSGS